MLSLGVEKGYEGNDGGKEDARHAVADMYNAKKAFSELVKVQGGPRHLSFLKCAIEMHESRAENIRKCF